MVLALGCDDIVEVVQDREQVDNERKIEVRDQVKRRQNEDQQRTLKTCGIMDGMWMERMRT